MVKWQPWPYLLDLLDILCTYQEVDIDKARQLGVTWSVIGYGFHVNHFSDMARNLYLSQGEVEAFELITKTKFIHEHLPDYMQREIDNRTRGWLTFKNSHSQIRALPSTEKAGSGYNASIVIRDELYNHPMGEENFAYIAPSIDSGGQMINLSAVYGDDMENHFVTRVSEFYRDSQTVKKVYPSGLELYTNPKYPARALVFLGWRLRPVRLEGMTLDEFYETRLKPRYAPRDLDRQYPSCIEDTLRIARASNYFDIQSVEDMGYDLCQPIHQEEVDTYNGIVRVYKPPVTGKQYVLFTDPSDGADDPFVTGVMDYVTGEVVCSATGKVKVGFVASIHDYLSRKYNNATNSYEYNAVGMAFAKCIDDLNTPNQAARRKTDGKADETKRGQFVSERHKQLMFADLAIATVNRQYIIHDREFVQQAKLVTRDDNGFPETKRKFSFDWVMMMNGLWQLQKHSPKGDIKIVRMQYGG